MLEFSHRQQALHLQAGDVWRQFLRDFHEASQNTNAPIPPPLPPGVVGTERFRPSTDALGGTMDDFLTAQQRASMSAAAAASGGGVPGAPGYPLGSEEEPEDLSSIWTEEAGQGRGFSSSGGDRGGGGGSAGGGSRRGSRSGSRGGGGGNPLNRGPTAFVGGSLLYGCSHSLAENTLAVAKLSEGPVSEAKAVETQTIPGATPGSIPNPVAIPDRVNNSETTHKRTGLTDERPVPTFRQALIWRTHGPSLTDAKLACIADISRSLRDRNFEFWLLWDTVHGAWSEQQRRWLTEIGWNVFFYTAENVEAFYPQVWESARKMLKRNNVTNKELQRPNYWLTEPSTVYALSMIAYNFDRRFDFVWVHEDDIFFSGALASFFDFYDPNVQNEEGAREGKYADLIGSFEKKTEGWWDNKFRKFVDKDLPSSVKLVYNHAHLVRFSSRLIDILQMLLREPKDRWRSPKPMVETLLSVTRDFEEPDFIENAAYEQIAIQMASRGDAGALEALWVLWVSPLPFAARKLMEALVELAVSTRASV
uniref:Uncharacterized protein n=1 Tax=Chromera velia CCMP2878 TaxID=1169474 RepID=A0A0G4HT61_9ALVE|eukprot:Cvel_31232.t1-p1 / transcript=Cvel_31232.t1 / gene=Cvel_31232 / organism=Chromera_velia_CCMP2878 / gene_product=hypothetical protein / transcript_product=hypothetical protein / location=Cvel_scaffold4618:56-8024(+) / protein_length=534 / sequence_SO=supercontig / SO=protein_coding / is_pseudo=false